LAAALLASALLAGCFDKSAAELEASARERLEKDDAAGAMIDARNALASQPNSASGRLTLGRALMANGELAAAAIEFERADKAGASKTELFPLQAQLLLLQGKSAAVIFRFERQVLNDAPADAELQLAVAKAHLLQGDNEAALAALGAALKQAPGHPGALIMQARMVAQGGQLKAAVESLDKLLATQASLAAAWSAKGDILSANAGDKAAAVQAYRKAIELKPKLAAAHTGLIRLLMLDADPAEFDKQLDAMAKVLPEDPSTSYLQGVRAYRTGKYARARELGQFLLRRVGDQEPLLYLTALSEWQLGGLRQAETLLTRLLQLNPESKLAQRDLASLLLQAGQPAKALATLSPLTEAGIDDADTWSIQGQAQLREGDFKAADASFARAAKLRPADTRIRTEIGKSLILRGDIESGTRELESAAQAAQKDVAADLQLVAVHMSRGNPQAALKAAAAMAAKQPQAPLPDLVKGRILQAQKDETGARQAFEAALAKDAKYLPAVSSLAEMDLLKNDLASASKRYEAVLKVLPKSAESMMALAVITRRTGKGRDAANGWVDKAVSTEPQNVEVWRQAIQFHRDEGRLEAALVRAQAAAAALPDDPTILAELAATQLAAKEPRQAIQSLNRMAQVLPKSPDAQLRLAQAQLDAGDIKAARQHVNRAVELAPNWPMAQRASVMLALGPENNPVLALQTAQALQKRPATADLGWELQGDVDEAQSRHAAAAQAYRQALRKAPTSPRASALHRVLLQQAQGNEARQWEQEWLTSHPGDPYFLQYLAESASQRGDLATAEAHYRTLLKAQPNDMTLLNNLAYVLVQRKNPEALATAERAVLLAPYQPAVLDTFAFALAEAKQHERAASVMRVAVDLAPQAGGFRLTLARYLISAGKKDKARDELKRLTLPGTNFPEREAAEKLLRDTAG
jgi:putative PEP-CTERM system TPR-repeat lipoprotein